jgi:hypothetical protein
MMNVQVQQVGEKADEIRWVVEAECAARLDEEIGGDEVADDRDRDRGGQAAEPNRSRYGPVQRDDRHRVAQQGIECPAQREHRRHRDQ